MEKFLCSWGGANFCLGFGTVPKQAFGLKTRCWGIFLRMGIKWLSDYSQSEKILSDEFFQLGISPNFEIGFVPIQRSNPISFSAL